MRSSSALHELIDADPYAKFRLPPNAKRVVTFLGHEQSKLVAPFESDGVRFLASRAGEVFIAYTPNPRGPVFMKLIEEHLGVQVTTRTWETVKKCAGS